MDSYHSDLREYFKENQGKLLVPNVSLLILNCVTNVTTNLYYSLKDYLPDEKLDYDFIRVKMINELSTEFEGIKTHQSNREINELTEDQIREVLTKGFTIIKLKNGKERRITQQNIVLSKEEYDKYMESKNESTKTNH
jgi:hypothetical protein